MSNDNAYQESFYKTMKHGVDKPPYFMSVYEAQQWVFRWVSGYNNEHMHSGLGMYTPAQVATGQWRETAEKRQKVMEDHYRKHPERYSRKNPAIPKTPAQLVMINATSNTARHALASTVETLLKK